MPRVRWGRHPCGCASYPVWLRPEPLTKSQSRVPAGTPFPHLRVLPCPFSSLSYLSFDFSQRVRLSGVGPADPRMGCLPLAALLSLPMAGAQAPRFPFWECHLLLAGKTRLGFAAPVPSVPVPSSVCHWKGHSLLCPWRLPRRGGMERTRQLPGDKTWQMSGCGKITLSVEKCWVPWPLGEKNEKASNLWS